jgi:glycosyltransferase involved in cell wall biosynthesis
MEDQVQATQPCAELTDRVSASYTAGERGADGVLISVCIVCRNEADRLEVCLASVAWADEIIVMDLSSDDDSAAIARKHGARVITRVPFPIVEPLRNELSAAARGEWILALDPDERVSAGLADELRRLAQRTDLHAVVIPRMNWDFGYPPSNPVQRYEPQLRMYRRAHVTWPVVPNALPAVADRHKHRLPDQDNLVIVHIRNRNIPEALERAMRYAPAQAQSMIDQGQAFTARSMLVALLRQVDKEFFRGQAWKDGFPGLLRAVMLVGYKFYVWAAFWQLSSGRRTAADDRLIWRLGLLLVAMRQLMWICGAPYRLAMRLLGRP